MSDLTGRKQFTKNLSITWISHFFVLIAGFVVPRQISDTLGQDALGIWDLAWATVNYLSLTGFGVATSLNREVAFLRSSGNYDALKTTCTTVQTLQTFTAFFVALIAFLVAEPIAKIVLQDSPESVVTATTVLQLLVSSLAIKMLAMPSGGILAGCHRWDLQNGLNGLHDVLLAMALLYCLWHDLGLVAMAWSALLAAVLVSIVRIVLSRSVCPEVRLVTGGWSWPIAKRMFSFGIKIMLIDIPNVVTFQTSALLLAANLGPAGLAVMNRSVALTRHVELAIHKVAAIFLPMTSGSLGLNEHADKYKLLVEGARGCMFIALPAAIFLGFVGDLLVYVWMGPAYSNHSLMMLLALGTVLPFTQKGTAAVLAGLDAHGRMAIWTIVTTALTLAICVLIAFSIGWSLLVAAAVISVTRTVGFGIAVQLYVAQLCKVSWWRFFADTIKYPLLLNLPLITLMALARMCFDSGHWHIAIFVTLIAFLVTLMLYFTRILPQQIKDKFIRLITFGKMKSF